MATVQNALVTGANKGIGFEIARQLAEKGFRVFVTARNRQRGLAATARLQQTGAKVEFVELDVANSASIAAAAKEIAAKIDHLDVLVNNAGILARDKDGSILTVTSEVVAETFQTNTLGPVLVTQAFWPLLAKKSGSRVINISSGGAQLSEMESWSPAYSISKTALNAVTRQFASVGKEAGVVVNSVCPGWVRTDMGGAQATSSLAEGADTAVWLASEAPHSLTGGFFRNRESIPW